MSHKIVIFGNIQIKRQFMWSDTLLSGTGSNVHLQQIVFEGHIRLLIWR